MKRFYHLREEEGGPTRPIALRPVDAARRLGISPRTLWNWTRAGIVPCLKVGRVTLYPAAGLEAWVASQTAAPPKSSADGEAVRR